MIDQPKIDFRRIEKAIAFISDNFQSQPSLEEIASAINVSPFHFQRLFTNWAGVSPKQFIRYLSLDYSKQLLKERDVTLLDAALATGLSGTSRLHDMFVSIEGITPGTYKKGGSGLSINHSFAESPFGNLIVASTDKGVCHMAFSDEKDGGLNVLKQKFPNAQFNQMTDKFQQDALFIFNKDWENLDKIKLHLTGTPFQLKVWEALLKIPTGALCTYGDIASKIGKPNATRAVGTAIGKNPIAFLIPCHRVIQSTGGIGNYMWGSTRKKAIIGWEAATQSAGS